MNRHICWLAVLFSIRCTSLCSQDYYSIYANANAYIAAGDLQKAANLFEAVQKEKLEPWQVQRVFYNLGTIALIQHQFEESRDYFFQVNDSLVRSPRLLHDLFYNIAISYYKEALHVAKEETYFSWLEVIDLVDQAIEELQKVKEFDCLVDKMTTRLSDACQIEPHLERLFIGLRDLKVEAAVKAQERKSDLNEKSSAYKALVEAWILAHRHLEWMKQSIGSGRLKENVELQSKVIDQAKLFVLKAVKQQQEQFVKLKICQKTPWNKVIPLFYKGFQYAERVKNNLEISLSSLRAQRQVLNYWKKAINEMDKKFPGESEEEASNQEALKNEQLRTLQEMFKEDQSEERQSIKGMSTW